MKLKTILIIPLLLCSIISKAQFTRVQFINNSPDVAVTGIDIYVNGNIAFNNLFFRESSPYLDIPAGIPVNIAIADFNSMSVSDTFTSVTATLSVTNRYVIVANGVKASTGYTPYKKFALHFYNMGQEGAASNQTDILFMNGSTDAPIMDIRTGIDILANDINYGDFGNAYNTFSATGLFNFRITNTTGSKTTHNFEADLSFLPVTGKGVVALTSGFLNPGNNSNGEPFGLWIAVPQGGPMYQLMPTTAEQLARVQLIHNTADTSVGLIDVYVNNQKVIDTLNFRQATTYLDAYANTTLNVGIAKSGSSTQFFNTNITLDSGRTYAAVLHGIESDTNYKPLPPLTISLFNNAREEATVASNTDVLFMHSSTDFPVSDISDRNRAPLSTNIVYGGFSTGYSSFNIPPAILRVDTGTNKTHLNKYEIKITDWNLAGKTATVLFSGFAVPDSNSKGPAFGFWAALPEGGNLRQLPVFVSVNDITKKAEKLVVWPNPTNNEMSFNPPGRSNNITITDVTGKVLMQMNSYSGNTLQVSNLPSGTYLLFVENSEEQIFYSKFMKQ